MKRDDLKLIVKNVALLSQLGLSIITPVLLCVAFAWYLNSRVGLGLWVYIPGFIFGLLSSFMTGYKFYLSEIKKEQKKEKKKTVSFNRHI